MLSNLIKWHKIGVKPYQMLSHVIKSCQSLWLYDILWNLIYPNPNPSLCIYYTSFYFMWKTCNTCALTCQHHSTKPLLVPFFAVAPLGPMAVRTQPRRFWRQGPNSAMPTISWSWERTTNGEDGRILMWLLVCYGLLWLISCYFIFFWRFYGFRDFWRCPMILNGGIWGIYDW